MRFTLTTVLATILATATAIPHAPAPVPAHGSNSDLTGNAALISQAQSENKCGNAHLSCCESTDNSVSISEEEKLGLLDLLGGRSDLLNNLLGKYSGCSSLASVEGIVGAGGGQGLVSGQCNNHVACCDAGDNQLTGVLNVAVPCIPVNVL
ncbi:hypothetical protein BDW74DRAFT_183568 [Aspergillus multicolor]|uniref:uncharacterized protein n=1 Tax=Aspergillus multicolor TaxID=41759 RepID=UPI003CCE0130